jgi:hypothetical protein
MVSIAARLFQTLRDQNSAKSIGKWAVITGADLRLSLIKWETSKHVYLEFIHEENVRKSKKSATAAPNSSVCQLEPIVPIVNLLTLSL